MMNNIPEVKPGLIAVSRDCFPIRLPREEEHQDNLANRDHQENDNGLPEAEIMNFELLFPIHRHFLSDELFPFWKQLGL